MATLRLCRVVKVVWFAFCSYNTDNTLTVNKYYVLGAPLILNITQIKKLLKYKYVTKAMKNYC